MRSLGFVRFVRSGPQALLVPRWSSIFFTSSSVRTRASTSARTRKERSSVGKELLSKEGNTAYETSTVDCL